MPGDDRQLLLGTSELSPGPGASPVVPGSGQGGIGKFGCSRWAHNPEIPGSNPGTATGVPRSLQSGLGSDPLVRGALKRTAWVASLIWQSPAFRPGMSVRIRHDPRRGTVVTVRDRGIVAEPALCPATVLLFLCRTVPRNNDLVGLEEGDQVTLVLKHVSTVLVH
jgi:hypothetical protein